jgi:hypothetical protein
MRQLEKVMKLRQIKTKGQYYSERRVVPKEGNTVIGDNQKILVFMTGQCPDCGSQFFADLDLSKPPEERPCVNKECKTKFIYKDNAMFSI